MQELPLPALSVREFRGLKSLDIPELSQFTLIAGDNGVGKTTVLQAAQIYADRGHPFTLIDIANNLDEVTTASDPEGGQLLLADLSYLLHGRQPTPESRIRISANGIESALEIHYGPPTWDPEEFLKDDSPHLTASFQGQEKPLRLRDAIQYSQQPRFARRQAQKLANIIPCETLGPALPEPSALAAKWDKIALTEAEDCISDALRLLCRDQIKRIGMVGDDVPGAKSNHRRPVVKTDAFPQPQPLRSFGEGAIRMFTVALALVSAPPNGLFLIDEIDNGLHRQHHAGLWKVLLEIAEAKNIQVLATTHSWDCVVGFTQALTERENPNGCLIRLSQKAGWTKAVHYSLESLQIAIRQGIEVR